MAQFTSDDVDHTITVPGLTCSYAPPPVETYLPSGDQATLLYWDDDIGEEQVCDLVRNGSSTEKGGVVGRIVELLLIDQVMCSR